MWYGHVPSVKHLRVFGSTCYALIPKIPHLEGGIPILDQHVESSSEEHSPPHETSTTDDALSYVIDRIERLNLDSVPTQSTEKPRPSQKGPPKWLTKTLESVHPDEIGKTGTRNSNRQNGGDVGDSNSPVDMDFSYDCELNLSIDFEPTSFKEAASHDEWEEVMQKEYDALIKNGTWKLVDPPFGTKPVGCKWVYKNKYKADGSLDKHKARLMKKDFDGDKETGVSTLGYAMSLGSGAISWRSHKQSVPADSTTEAEYVAAAEAKKEIVWRRKILEDLQIKQVQ
eukprot:PITA_13758